MSDRNLKSLSGKWRMSKDSTGVPDVMKIQGFGIVMRKAVSMAPINLSIKQDGTHEIIIDQTTTANIPGITEKWYPGDGEWREQQDRVMGKTKGQCKWTKVSAVEPPDEELVQGLQADDEIIEANVQSLESVGWTAHHVWCFEGEQFVRRVLVTGKDGTKAFSRLVYEVRK